MPTIGSFIQNNRARLYENTTALRISYQRENVKKADWSWDPSTWIPAAQEASAAATDFIANNTTYGVNPDKFDRYNRRTNLGLTQEDYARTALGTDDQGKPIFSFGYNNNGNTSAVTSITSLQEFANQDAIADGVVYNLQKTPLNQRENNPFIQQMRNLANISRKSGDEQGANELDASTDALIKGVGTYGKNMLSLQQIARQAQIKMREGLDRVSKSNSTSSPTKLVFNAATKRYETMTKNPAYIKSLSNYQNNYLKNNAYANPYDNALYGMFKSPEARGAFQHAAPWLAYGIPAAALTSLLTGNSKLWPLVLGGAALFGGLGYAKNKGMLGEFGNSSIMNTIGNFTALANQPFKKVINSRLPGSEPITDDLFGTYMSQQSNQGNTNSADSRQNITGSTQIPDTVNKKPITENTAPVASGTSKPEATPVASRPSTSPSAPVGHSTQPVPAVAPTPKVPQIPPAQ